MDEFRKLKPHELEDGYAVLMEAYEWLNARGSNQWPEPLPLEKYRRWHKRGLNYGFFFNGILSNVLSLVAEIDHRWHDFMPDACVMWIRAVAGSDKHRGRGFGKLAIQAAVEKLVNNKQIPIYLHCYKGNGFLPKYYTNLGFETLSETELDNGPWILMKHSGTQS
jgi:GNAT superfamily N-acetyltransferase